MHSSRPTRSSPAPTVHDLLPITLLALLALACGGESDGRRAANGSVAADSQPSVIPALAARYREVAVENGGAVAGRITFAGDAPEDTVVRPTSDEAECGTRARPTTVQRAGDRLSGAVVWLADVRSGKSFPLERRYTLTIEHCSYTPRVQTAVTGGTLNVLSLDEVEHRTRLSRQTTGQVLEMLPQFEDGSLVPVRSALEHPGLIEIACERHPWSRAWLAVFDHPYYAESGRDGAFAIETVPPGDYTLMAWHERFGRVEMPVRVAAGARTDVELKFGEAK